jgi:hypothetical protein
MLTSDEFNSLILAWSKNHILAIESLFNISLTDQQKQLVNLANNQTARVAVSSGTGTGKTSVLTMMTLLYLMILPDCRILITSPSFNQLSRVFSSELKKWYRKMPKQFQDFFTITRDTIRYTNSERYEQFASLVTASVDNKEALQGGHAENYVIFADEASGINEEAFDILIGTLSTGKGGRFIQVSNPVRSSGRFYQIFQSDKSTWDRLYFSAIQSPNVNREWIAEMKQTYGEDSDLYRMRVLGQFPRVGVSQFIGSDIVEAAFYNQLEPISYMNFPKIMGVDIARFGDDKTCFVVRQGPKIVDIKVYTGLNTMEVAARVSEYQAMHKCVQIHIDAIGIGAGTYDRCKELNLPVVEVNVSSKSTEPNIYCNLRSQIWGKMKDWLQNGASIPQEYKDILGPELTSMEYFYNSKMQLQLMSKKDLKKAGHPSPDTADALSLTFSSNVFDVKRRHKPRLSIRKPRFLWI